MPSQQPDQPEQPNPNTWTVWREDEYGNRFEVRRDLRFDQVSRLAAAYQARGHKQRYWPEPAT
jgi:hypothetical protein